ncbi:MULTISPECIES: ABC transporter substrate-binding protein [Erwinia]|uniref:ABC transporter substrate-binding protein n=1 Tax=Erwinia TaxID=551 RepID=UPI00055488B8|nr:MULTISPECIES: ABC transporter substrate-binding protein [Erwinia]
MRLKYLVLSLSLIGVVPAHALDDVTVALAIPPAVHDGAPYAAAEELGLFRQQNLAVRLLVFQGAGALLPQVASKRVTFGYPVSEPVISSYFNGKNPLPLRYFYNGTPQQTLEYTVLADSSIKTLADLKGKKIGVGALTWGTLPNSRAALRVAGLEPGKNVEFVAVGSLGSGFQALRSKKIDALNYNSSWGDIFELTGTKIRRIAYPAVFQENPGNGFIAHQDTFKENPDLIRRFGRAWTEAQYVCEINPEYCVKAFWRQHPESKPADADGKGLEDAKTLLSRRLARTLYRSDGSPRVPGEYDLKVIHNALAAMAKAGEFPDANVPLEKIFSNEFVAAFNDFDKKALRARAEAAK